MKKIIQYYSHYYPGSGGVETHIRDLVNNLDYDFEIVSDAIIGQPMKCVENGIRITRISPVNRSINVSQIPIHGKTSYPIKVYRDYQRIKNKHRYLSKSNYDMIHFHNAGIGRTLTKIYYKTHSKLMYKVLKKLMNYSEYQPNLVTIHGLLGPMTSNNAAWDIENDFISHFQNIICVDKNILKHVIKTFPGTSAAFIPNGVDITRFQPYPFVIDKKLKIGFIGRLENSRGISILNKLIENTSTNNTEFHIIGSGNTNVINDFAKKIKKYRHVHFYPNIPYEDVHSYYRKMDILFNPVIAEGISRVTLESMACGRPVIMLNKGDRYPILKGKTGYLVKPEISEIVTLLGSILDSKDKLSEMASNARKIVETEFSNDVIIPKIKNVYTKILENTK